jgi:hypothetical protein
MNGSSEKSFGKSYFEHYAKNPNNTVSNVPRFFMNYWIDFEILLQILYSLQRRLYFINVKEAAKVWLKIFFKNPWRKNAKSTNT